MRIDIPRIRRNFKIDGILSGVVCFRQETGIKRPRLVFRRLLVVPLALSIFVSFPACRRERTDAAPKVPIILLSIDTLRADHLSCYGYGLETSPTIDSFAREAVLFENAFSPSPVTTPSHVSLFTATTPAVHGRINISSTDGDYEPLPARIISAAEVLKANGYITLGLHGGGNVEGLCGLKRGFDYYASVPHESLNSRLAEVIRSTRTSADPFFIFLHHYACHDPYTKGPRELRLRFAKGHEAESTSIIDEIEGLKDSDQRRKRFWRHFDLKIPVERELVTALYDGGVLYSDALFAGTLDVLKKEGLYEDALIIVLSDHGEEFYEHRGKLHWRLFIETLHVPMLIKFPNQKFGGRRISGDVRTSDLFPTVFEYLGIKPLPPSFHGESFLPLVLNKGTYDPLIMSFSPWGNRVRFHGQGFVFVNEPVDRGEEPYWIFDRKSDPREKVNLADAKPELLRQMESRSREILRQQQQLSLLFRDKSGKREKIDEDVLETLRALGYVK
jgi:arylsulfatase A-like enzyme